MIEHPVKDQIFINKLTGIILANLGNENFGVNELVHEAAISHYSLNRRLQGITKKTIKQFIREVRLQRALEMLQNEEIHVSEVAYKVGFGSPAYFNTCFHEYFGYPPGAVKKGDFVNSIKTVSSQIGLKQKKNTKRLIILISSGIVIIVILGFIVHNLLFRNLPIGAGSNVNKPEKSIAVLPFKNLSDSAANQYFIDGLMEEILANLSKIHNLRVISRTSVEPFRGTDKSSTQIGKELKVDYIVEGSGQKYGNIFRLRVQLIEASSDRHVWTESYEQEIKEVKDIFGIQSSIAQAICSELKAVITPEEKQMIEKIPTENLTAFDFYQRGREEHIKYWNENNIESLRNAENLYRKALQYDSTYARAYTGLAWVYWDKRFYPDYLSENFMDTVPVLCNTALSFDKQLSEAHTLKGAFYSQTGKWELAGEEFDKAIKSNPNDWMAYRGKGEFYSDIEWVKSIDNYRKAASINHGPELPDLFSRLGYAFASAGFKEKARQYYQDKLILDGDSAAYYSELLRNNLDPENLEKNVGFCIRFSATDSTNVLPLVQIAAYYEDLGRYGESLKYYKKYIELLKRQGDLQAMHRMKNVGYIFWQNGNRKTADYYFDEQKRFCERAIEEGRQYERNLYSYYDLACIYAFRGERDKAFENLRLFNNKPMMSLWMIQVIEADSLLNSIRNEPEFQEIVRDIEAKYQAEHERVKKWLEEQGMI